MMIDDYGWLLCRIPLSTNSNHPSDHGLVPSVFSLRPFLWGYLILRGRDYMVLISSQWTQPTCETFRSDEA